MMMGEDRNKVSIDEDDPNDQFPVGMRVLAVDDDPTCLRLLESMLQRCQYNVTTTTHAMKALNILKDNKTKIDLIISDVDMPEMDGFKLLELVGLEMDLPVIMLSAYGETKFVMKGIKHGACDYLLKPVRIEELKNIWQHVLRKKKPNSKHANSDENLENPPKRTLEEGQSSAVAILHIDQNGESNKKRKDQDEDDDNDDESEENDNDSEDQSTHKKPRVVWTPELHQLFLSAVNQLGVDKAVPKKILSLMNVERLSRENVASHLQKYRLYMKKLNTGDSHQANMMATLRGRTNSYSRMGTALDRFNDFQAFTRSTSLSNVGYGSYPPGAMLGRLNTPSLGLHGFSSGMGQLGYASNSSQSTMFLGNRYGSFERTSTSLKIEQLQQNKYPSRMGELAPAIDDPSLFSLLTDYLNPSTNIGSSSNQGNMEIPSSVSIPPPNQGTFDTSVGVPAQINWQGVDPLTGFPSNLLPMGDPFDQVGPSSYLDDFSSFSTSMTPSTSLQNTITGTQNQVIIDDFHVAENNLPDFGMNNMVDQLMNSSSPINDVSHSFSQSLVQDNAINGNPSLIDQSNGGPSSMLLSEEFENHLDQGVSNNNGFVANSSSASKNALRDAMIKHFN